MNCLKYFAVIISVSGSLTVTAQQALTPEQCRRLAIENNKQMTIAAENSKKSDYILNAFRSNFFPKLSATGNYLFSSASMQKTIPGSYLPTFVPDATGQLIPNILTNVDGVSIFREYAYFPDMNLDLKLNGTYMVGLRLEQPIYTGGKITSAYRISQTGREVAKLNEEKTRTEIILQADKAYWAYVLTFELEKIAKAYNKLIEHLLTDIGNAYEAGLKSRNDLLKVQVKQNEAQLQLLQATNAMEISRMNLCHITGLPLATEIIIEDLLEEPLQNNILPADITNRPEYKIMSKQIEMKAQQVKLARSEFLPNVGVIGNFGYANGLKLNGDKLLDKTSFSAVVSVSIPLFNWGEGRNKIRSATTEKNIATLQRNELSGKMELELLQARNSLDESQMEVMLTKRSLKQAEENLRESRNRYEAGMETLSDYLEAQTLWQQACYELIRAKTSAQIAITGWLKAAGQL